MQLVLDLGIEQEAEETIALDGRLRTQLVSLMTAAIVVAHRSERGDGDDELPLEPQDRG